MKTTTLTDKELLELAAKAIGLKLQYNYLGGRDANQPWDPLEDDGDALRLVVELGLAVSVNLTHTSVGDAIYVDHGYDKHAATRRAIVMAAAELN